MFDMFNMNWWSVIQLILGLAVGFLILTKWFWRRVFLGLRWLFNRAQKRLFPEDLAKEEAKEPKTAKHNKDYITQEEVAQWLNENPDLRIANRIKRGGS